MTKIKNALPPPTHCDCCGGQKIVLTDNSVLYGKTYGDWPLIWFCQECEAAVGCHPTTRIPLGKLANRETRTWRSKTHEVFDPIWREHRWITRYQAYTWLAGKLGIPPEECHISWFDADTCKRAIEICSTDRPLKRDYHPKYRNRQRERAAGQELTECGKRIRP